MARLPAEGLADMFVKHVPPHTWLKFSRMTTQDICKSREAENVINGFDSDTRKKLKEVLDDARLDSFGTVALLVQSFGYHQDHVLSNLTNNELQVCANSLTH